jgi:hypothetical protein
LTVVRPAQDHSKLASPVAARDLARNLLGDLGDRWIHTQNVAGRAESVIHVFPDDDRRLLVAAAWLHDIGYSPEVAVTGFHPLDGARYLHAAGAPPDLVGAVAHHSCASYEAEERSLTRELDAFPPPSIDVLDALTFADMTTGPTGGRVTVKERLAEILGRYRPEDPVHRAVDHARVDLMAAVRRTELRLADAESDQPM